MILTPLATAASVSDFSSGTSEVEVVLNDASTFTNEVDGSIDLPVGESITSASVAVSTSPASVCLYVCRKKMCTGWDAKI